MTNDLSLAVAGLLKSIDEVGLNYVVYRDQERHDRLVVIVEGIDDAHALQTMLKNAGAESSESDYGYDMTFKVADDSGAIKRVGVVLKTASGKVGVANLLWRAASQESALAARTSVEESH